jgi:hypothetical protein
MDPETPESPDQAAPTTQADVSAPAGAEPSAADAQAPPDAAALVDRMVAAGEWPEPALLEQIAQAGGAAVEPLIAILRTYPRGWPDEAPLVLAIGLLSMIRPARTMPELIEIIRRYGNETGEAAGRALGHFGPAAFEPLLEVCRDPAVTGSKRSHAIDAAKVAAGSDAALRTRLADVIRPLLAEAIGRGREGIRLARMQQDREEQDEDAADLDWADAGEGEEDADDEGYGEEASEAAALSEPGANAGDILRHEDATAITTDLGASKDEDDSEVDLYSEIALLVNDLSELADPSARELIKTAFDEDLVEAFFIDEKSVDELYREGGEIHGPGPDWLDTYREAYQRHIDYLNRPKAPAPTRQPRHPSGYVEPEDKPAPYVQETIRNVGPKLGRNDPCWCGSGKKYKKCHLGKDSLT